MTNVLLHSRHSVLVPEATRAMTVAIIGAGMTGSWTTMCVARIVKSVHVWDFDHVEHGNLGVQAYSEMNLEEPKVHALETLCFGLNVVGHNERFDTTGATDAGVFDVVVAAVDNMESRKEIAEWCDRWTVPHYIDTRVLGEIAAIQVVGPGLLTYEQYLAELPSDADTPDAPCGAVGTPFTGMWLGSQVAAIINAIGRGSRPPQKVVWHVGLNQMIAQESGGTVSSNT